MLGLISDLIITESPDFVVIEGTQYQNNFSTYGQLSQLQGVIIGYLLQKNIGFAIVQPTMWRKVCGITGKGREETKKNTRKFVREKYSLDVGEDESDAIGIAQWSRKIIEKVDDDGKE